MRRKRRSKTIPSVWAVGRSEGGVEELFESREDAMRWLLRQHEEAVRSAAQTEEYWRRNYTDRAAMETDPAMRAYYSEQLAKRNPVGPIEDNGNYGAAFSASEWDRVYINEMQVHTYEPVDADAAPHESEVEP